MYDYNQYPHHTGIGPGGENICPTPGLRIRSKGLGRGLARGRGRGPIGIPFGMKMGMGMGMGMGVFGGVSREELTFGRRGFRGLPGTTRGRLGGGRFRVRGW